MAVCKPFYHLTHNIKGKYYLISITFAAFAYNFPRFLEFKTLVEDKRACVINETVQFFKEGTKEVLIMPLFIHFL